jgi:hypothetical protein
MRMGASPKSPHVGDRSFLGQWHETSVCRSARIAKSDIVQECREARRSAGLPGSARCLAALGPFGPVTKQRHPTALVFFEAETGQVCRGMWSNLRGRHSGRWHFVQTRGLPLCHGNGWTTGAVSIERFTYGSEGTSFGPAQTTCS